SHCHGLRRVHCQTDRLRGFGRHHSTSCREPEVRHPRAGHDGGPSGRRTVNTEPLPGSLFTVMSPPIIWQNFRLITSPRPVPPYLLAVFDDAWENSWNSFPICSCVIPMPVSATESVIQSRPFSRPW